MTKREYMQQLSRALEGYEQGFVQEILESYEEHFEAGLKSGRSEEEICRELGDIEELLREDEEDEKGDEVEFKKEERPLPKPVTAIEPVQYSGISKVQLNLFSMDAEISRSCDGELHVYLQSGEELSQYLEEQVEGDTYMVNEKKPMKKQPSLDLASLLRMMRNPTPKLMVELPERIEFLHGKTTSGDLKLDKLNHERGHPNHTDGGGRVGHQSKQRRYSTGAGQCERDGFAEQQRRYKLAGWSGAAGTAAYRQRRYRIDTSQWTEGRAYKRQRGHRAGRRAGRKMEGRNLQR